MKAEKAILGFISRLLSPLRLNRSLRRQLSSASLLLSQAQDEVVRYRERAETAEDKLRASLERELNTRGRMVDFFAQKWGATIFDNAPTPLPVEPQEPIPAKIQGRSLVREQNRRFAEQLIQRLTQEGPKEE